MEFDQRRIKNWLYPVSVPLWLISHIRNNAHHSDLSSLNGLKGTIIGYCQKTYMRKSLSGSFNVKITGLH